MGRQVMARVLQLAQLRRIWRQPEQDQVARYDQVSSGATKPAAQWVPRARARPRPARRSARGSSRRSAAAAPPGSSCRRDARGNFVHDPSGPHRDASGPNGEAGRVFPVLGSPKPCRKQGGRASCTTYPRDGDLMFEESNVATLAGRATCVYRAPLGAGSALVLHRCTGDRSSASSSGVRRGHEPSRRDHRRICHESWSPHW
jgi:hypothetical protein